MGSSPIAGSLVDKLEGETMNLHMVLLLISFVLALVAALGGRVRDIDLGWLAFAVFIAAQLV